MTIKKAVKWIFLALILSGCGSQEPVTFPLPPTPPPTPPSEFAQVCKSLWHEGTITFVKGITRVDWWDFQLRIEYVSPDSPWHVIVIECPAQYIDTIW